MDVAPSVAIESLGPRAEDYHAALQPLARAACRGPVVRCVVRLLDPGRRLLLPIAAWDAESPDRDAAEHRTAMPLHDDEPSPWGHAVSTGEPLLLDEGDLGELSAECLARLGHDGDGAGARIAIHPLAWDSEVLGIAAFIVLDAAPASELSAVGHVADRMALSLRAVELERRVAAGLRQQHEISLIHEETSELFQIGWELSSSGLAMVEPDGRILRVNPSLGRLAGYSPGDLAGRNVMEFLAEDATALARAYEEALSGRQTMAVFEHRLRHAQGHEVPVSSTARLLTTARGRPRMFFVAVENLTEPTRFARIRHHRSLVLDALVSHDPLTEILERTIALAEEHLPEARASILVADETQQRLVLGAAPSLPNGFVETMSGRTLDPPGVAIGPDSGPCATAAFLGRPMFTPDAGADDRWPGYQAMFRAHAIRGVWVMPVLCRRERVLATLAFHFGEIRTPTSDETQLMEDCARLIAVAIEGQRERDRAAAMAAELADLSRQQAVVMDFVSDGIVYFDLDGRCTAANASAELLLGWTAAELRGMSVHKALHHSLPDGSPQPPQRSPMVTCLQKGSVHQVRGDTLWTSAGAPVVVDYQCSPVEREGRIVGGVLVLHPTRAGERVTPADPILTDREREILRLLGQGRHGPEIAKELHIASTTLQSHLKSAIAKLGASGRTHAVILAVARGEIDLARTGSG